MITKFEATKQDEIEYTLTMTMPLKEWKALRAMIDLPGKNQYPVWHLVKIIREMVISANAHWVDNGDE